MVGSFELSQAKWDEAAAANAAATSREVSAHISLVCYFGNNILAAVGTFHGLFMASQGRLPSNRAYSLFGRGLRLALLRLFGFRSRRLVGLLRRRGGWLYGVRLLSSDIVGIRHVVVVIPIIVVVVVIDERRRGFRPWNVIIIFG